MKLTVLATATLAALANAHGYFISPTPRQPGTAYQNACGMQAYYTMSGDINGNIQGLEQIVSGQSDYNPKKCQLWKCKGMKYADNKDNVHHYHPGQTVPMNFHIQAPHDGYANVSIVSTRDNKVIHKNLKKWNKYALTSEPMKDSWQNFNIKMPKDLGSRCRRPGACVIQMYWNAPSIDQTYESCIDFTMSGSAGKRDALGLEMEERDHARDFNRV